MALEIFRLVGSVFVDTDAADKSLQKTDKTAQSFGKTLLNGINTAAKWAAGVVGAATAAGTALVAVAENTREYRTEQGKLQAAFETSGFAGNEARSVYEALNSVLGDSAQAVEAANHLAKLCDNAEDLSKWTNICTGVFATFGDSLPIEGLTEAANETAKVGTVTGVLADALNWAGVSEDAFNESLANCTTEQERQALITSTLNGLYSKAADNYREVNAEVIAANAANEKLNASMALVGGAVEPVITQGKTLIAEVLERSVPYIELIASVWIPMLVMTLTDSAMWISENSAKIVEWTGYVVAAGVGVGTFLVYLNWGQIMTAAAGALDLVTTSIRKMTSAIQANPIGMLISLITSLIAYMVYLYNTNEEFRVFVDAMLAVIWVKLQSIIAWIQENALPVLIALVEWISTNILPVIQDLITWVTEAFAGFWAWLTSSFESTSSSVGGIWETIKGYFQSAWDFIKSVWEACQPFFQGIWDGIIMPVAGLLEEMFGAFAMAWEDIKLIWGYVEPFFSAIWEGIKIAVSILWEFISTGFKNAWEVITGVWDVAVAYFAMIWENIEAIFSVVITVLGGFFSTAWEAIKAVWNVAISFFTMVWAGIKAVFAVVKGVLSGDFTDAWEAIKNVWEKAKTFFVAVWNGIKGVFGSVVTWFGNTFKSAWAAIKSSFSAWGTFFGSLWTTIKDKFSAIGTNIAGAISSSVKAGINGVITAIEGTINTGVGLINGAIDLINLIPGVSVGKLAKLDLPQLYEGAVLEKGQTGILEGNGAEAVVPLHNNKKWISAVAQDMSQNGIGGGSAASEELLDAFLEFVAALPGILVNAFAQMRFGVNNREFARLVKEAK